MNAAQFLMNIMNHLSLLRLIAILLELSVPVYGVVLMQRFGRHSVGRFLVIACGALVLLHLFGGFTSKALGLPILDLSLAFASGFLLIGLGHLQSLYTQRRQNECEGQKLSANWKLTLKEKTADLAGTNQQLLEEIARHQESERALQQSEQQYRFIFSENPQPQWIFDLRSLKVLAVNRSALGLFGSTREEFMASPANNLFFPDAMPFFMRDAAIPCPRAQSRGHWLLRKNDGTPIEVRISGVDLNYDGCPARLVVAAPMVEQRHHDPEQPQATNMERTSNSTGTMTQSVHRAVPVIEQRNAAVPNLANPTTVSEPKRATGMNPASPAPTFQRVSLDSRIPAPPEPAKAVGSNPRLIDVDKRVARKDTPSAKTVQASQKLPAPKRCSAPGKETILLVEPDGKARGLARFILTRQGYRVIETDCGSTVLALWESQSANVDLLLTDVALPEGSGRALADQLRQTNPELKVIYACAPVEGEGMPMDQDVIPKPFNPENLLQTVRNCLQVAAIPV